MSLTAVCLRLARRLLVIGALAAALSGLVSCAGNSDTGGPTGSPEVVLGKAPDVTLAARTAQIIVTSPTANATGPIDLTNHDGRLSVLATGYAKPASLIIVGGIGYAKTASDQAYTQLAGPGPVPQVLPSGDPWADIDLVRGTVHILSDGGSEVDGASTIGYTITVDPQQAIETTPAARQAAVRELVGARTEMFMMQVWIDTKYRIRRLEVPASFSFKSVTPPTRVDGENIATDVDFVSFGLAVPPTTPPPTTPPPAAGP